jgi:hypothetical protein
MPNVPKLSWTQVAVVLGTFAVVGLLAWMKIELTAFLSFAALVLVGVGVMQTNTTKDAVTEVKQQTNGNNQKLVDALLADRDQMRAAMLQALAYMPPEHAPKILDALESIAKPPPRELVAAAVVPAQRDSPETTLNGAAYPDAP